MKYLFLILSLLGFITYQDTVSTRPAAQTAVNGAISPSGPVTSTDLGPVAAFEDGLPIPRR
jgi:hypothetical protein